MLGTSGVSKVLRYLNTLVFIFNGFTAVATHAQSVGELEMLTGPYFTHYCWTECLQMDK